LPVLHQGADFPAHGIGALLQSLRDLLLIRQRTVLTQFQLPLQPRDPDGKRRDGQHLLTELGLRNLETPGGVNGASCVRTIEMA
jgi:hypothetical protein